MAMIAYFTASIVGKKYHLDNYQKIINHLKSHGFTVLSDHIMQATEDNIRIETKSERLAFQAKLEKWITSSDIMIVETTFPSISVGYEISLAIHRNKPVLMLYSEGDPPSLLAHHPDDKFICEKYTNETVNEILDDFIKYVSGTSDTRFTFFLTSELSSYLENISKKRKIPKSVYLRQLIEEDLNKHN
jgi:2'-deoxynucleoside 5'-phosphate N-hydrolase